MSYTRIADMPSKVCAEVCTLYVKDHGCQAPKTASMHGNPKDMCPVGKEQAQAWYDRNMRAKAK